jgi:RNase P/RNase MRP subunit p30
MRRIFADLHLKPNLADMELAERMLRRAAYFGYRLVSVPLAPTLTLSQNKQLIEQLTALSKEVGLDFVSRLDVKPKTSNELLRILRRFRRSFEIIAVFCESKAVARQAAKDRRVDLLNFSSDPRKRFFDEAEAELASRGLAALEIDIESIIRLEGAARVKLLAALRKEAAIAKAFNVPVVVSSGASEELTMRRPLEAAALTMLFDMDRSLALDAISKVPAAIVKRNREKLSPEFISPGIRLIRRGKDC